MHPLLKVISSTIWDNPLVEKVHFSDSPGVEARFWKELLEQRRIANLDVTATRTQTLYQVGDRNSTSVLVMTYPADSRSATVQTRKLMKLNSSNVNWICSLTLHNITEWSIDRIARAVDTNVQRCTNSSGRQYGRNFVSESEVWREWDRCYLGKIIGHSYTVQQTVIALTHNSPELYLKEVRIGTWTF